VSAPPAGPPEPSVGPRLIRTLGRLLLALFYRGVEVEGLARVPLAGPLVVAANHPNALVDPLVLLAILPRPLRPLAKAPLFAIPVIGTLVRLAGALPVHRRQDAGGDPARNAETFRAVAAALARGEAVLVFPEGVSQPEPRLMPLRTGVARMVLGTDAPVDGPAPVLLPVGLLVQEPGTFREGRVLVTVGEPVPVADLRARAGEAPERAVRELTGRLDGALRSLIVEAGDRETLRLASALEQVWRLEGLASVRGEPDQASGASAVDPDAARQAAWLRQATRAYRYLLPREPARLARLRGEVERYLRDLAALQVADHQVSRRYPPGALLRYAAREGVALAGGLPLALWGFASHALPYGLTALAARVARPEGDVEATVKLAAAALLYPACWAVEGWTAWRLGGGWALAGFLLALVPTGLVALGWRARLARVRRDARGFLRFLRDRDVLARLRARRRALGDELWALVRLVPAGVLDGRAGKDADPPPGPLV
jgi:1-acyl-sn-glycerol-3-phosphate acyltransferase